MKKPSERPARLATGGPEGTRLSRAALPLALAIVLGSAGTALAEDGTDAASGPESGADVSHGPPSPSGSVAGPGGAAPTAPGASSPAAANAVVQIGTVEVVGRQVIGAATGYKPETVTTTGPWGDRAIEDTPYSIHSTPAALIENMIAPSTDRLLLYMPTAAPTGATANSNAFLGTSIRGFSNAEVTRNGIPMRWSWLSTSTEDLDSIEIIAGLSGFLYGAGNVGGMTNLVSKRPTPDRRADLTLGNYGNEQWFVHADLGGPLDGEGRFGYRLNLLTQDGETMMRGQELARRMASGALDWHARDDLLVQFDAAYETHDIDRPTQYLMLWGAAGYPPADRVDIRRLYTNDWTYNDVTAKRLGTNLAWSPSDAQSVRLGYLKLWETREYKSSTYWIDDVGGIYVDSAKSLPADSWSDGAYLYFDQKFRALGLDHKLTVGANTSAMERRELQDGYNWQEFYYPDLDAALAAPEVAWPEMGRLGRYVPARQRYTNVLVGDDIALGERWSVLAGASRASISQRSYNTGGIVTSRYDRTAVTPTFSVIFKAWPNLSTYLTYMRSLQAGTEVSTTASPPYTNAGQILPPTIGKQLEIGAKATIGGTLLTAAIYGIDKANIYDDVHGDGTVTLTQDGRQVHRGLEMTVAGKATENLTLFGGANFIDPEITRTNREVDRGEPPVGVARRKLTAYAEYRLPRIDALYLTAGVSCSGSSEYIPNLKSYRARTAGYTVVDLGLRFEGRAFGKPVGARAGVSNLFDRHYYASGSSTLGAPRTFAFSATVRF